MKIEASNDLGNLDRGYVIKMSKFRQSQSRNSVLLTRPIVERQCQIYGRYETGFDETLSFKSRNLDPNFRGRLRPQFSIFLRNCSMDSENIVYYFSFFIFDCV